MDIRNAGAFSPGPCRWLAVWDGGEAAWAGLFAEQGPLSAKLLERLAGVDLALVFSPRPRPGFMACLVQGGVGRAVWVPSFPQGGAEAVGAVQARRLRELGIRAGAAPFRLKLPKVSEQDLGFSPGAQILTIGPGSGGPAKNWPLSHYYEIARALAFDAGLEVVWLTGPAEEQVRPYINGLAAAQGQVVWAGEPLGAGGAPPVPHPGICGGGQRHHPSGRGGRGRKGGGPLRPHRSPGMGPPGGPGDGIDPAGGSRCRRLYGGFVPRGGPGGSAPLPATGLN